MRNHRNLKGYADSLFEMTIFLQYDEAEILARRNVKPFGDVAFVLAKSMHMNAPML